MDLYVIAGFLGSGKTSLLLPLAKAVSESGRKMAIIENEVGDIGVDDAVLSGEGLPVKEIYSGCVCCSLRMDLITTLLELEREFKPDIVFLEPSGVASPAKVLSALQGYGGEIDRKQVVTVVDAERFRKLTTLDIPLIADGIHCADIIVLNKVDRVDEQSINDVSASIRELRPEVEIINVSVTNDYNVDVFIDRFIKAPPVKGEKPAKKVLYPARGGMEPVPYTHSMRVQTGSRSGKEHSSSLSKLIYDIGIGLEKAGCKVIGHIKAVVQTEKSGYLMASITSFGKTPDIKGRLPSGILDSVNITINIIVYGVTKDEIAEVVKIATEDSETIEGACYDNI